MLNEPRDFIGSLLVMLFRKILDDEKWRKRVHVWRMVVVLETDLYPVTLRFEEGIRIEYGGDLPHTLHIKTALQTVIDVISGSSTILGAVVSRKIKIGGLIRHPRAAFRCYRFLSAALGG